MSRRNAIPSVGSPTLPLFPDEEDVELPLELTAALERGRVDTQLRADLDELRRALVDALGYVESGLPAPGTRIRAWRELAGTAYTDGATPTERRDDGIARAAAKWTPEETAAVDKAIATVAQRHRDAWSGCAGAVFALEFTTADVWAELGDGFPVTKGIAGRMLAAKGAGLIANTGRTTIAPAGSTGPNHAQRLTIWKAL